ncbi:DNA-binding transcriptional MerR regulator [Bradyrhizobium sp. LM6.10]
MGDECPIGEVARRTGLKVPTIRYYEQIGLLPPLPRSDGNRRCYRDSDIRRLVFVRHARELGFEVEAIRTLLELQDQPEGSCREIDALVGEHLEAVDSKIQRLVALRGELQHMLACCRGGRVAECRVIESIFQLRSPSQTQEFRIVTLPGFN